MKKISLKVVVLAVACCAMITVLIGAVAVYFVLSITNQEILKQEAALRQNFDTTAKYEVQTAVSMLQDIYDRSQKGEYSLDEAKKRGEDLLRSLRYNESGYFWADTTQGVNVVLPTDTEKKVEGTNRYDAKDSEGNFYVHDFIANGLKEGGGYIDYYFVKLGGTEPAPKRSYTLAFKPFDWVVGTGNYVDDIDAMVAESKKEATERNASAFAVMFGMAVAAFAVAAVISFFWGKRVAKPILTVAKLINKTSRLDLTDDTAHNSLLKNKDETGIIAKEIFELRNILREMTGRLIAVSNSLMTHSEELSRSSDENVKTINQIVTTITEIAEGNSSQAEMINRTNTKIVDVVKTVGDLNSATAENANNSAASLEMISEGQNAVNLQSERMKENVEVAGEVSASVSELSAMVEKVGNIVGVITSIAEQTNLLALNAAIEAARAGEAGKGFAVVSDEIRKLAEGSSSAAKEITQIIAETTEKSRQAVENMGKARQIVVAQEEALDITKTAFGKIELAVGDIAGRVRQSAEMLQRIDGMSQEISNQSQDMAAVAEQSAASTEEISASSQEQLASIEMIAKSAGDLFAMAEDLDREIKRFRVA